MWWIIAIVGIALIALVIGKFLATTWDEWEQEYEGQLTAIHYDRLKLIDMSLEAAPVEHEFLYDEDRLQVWIDDEIADVTDLAPGLHARIHTYRIWVTQIRAHSDNRLSWLVGAGKLPVFRSRKTLAH
jgi:hypothetical protein